jgi:tRNA pseudouridine55 synthase
VNGVVIVDKPAGWTSHDVVGKMRGIAGTKRVGHLGTLDPLATGVLPLMIGQTTKLARFWDHSEKAYEAVIRFGFSTTTYDREGETVGPIVEAHVTTESVEGCLGAFRGQIDQKPPPVSAKKIGGVPAYKLARKNQPVDLPAVRVTVHELTLRSVEGDRASIFVRCSAGTYIRSITHELGMALGCGAHIEALVRTASGPFLIDKAFTLEQLQEMKNEGRLEEAITKPTDLLPHFPPVFVDDTTERHIRQGRDFAVSAFRVNLGTEHVKAIGPAGDLIAIGKVALPHVYHPIVVLNA